MPRPSQRFDLALLESGRVLFPQAGCAGLSVRAVAEHAGANLGMFHYHFKSKDNFLRVLLADLYERMVVDLHAAIEPSADARERLRRGLLVFGRFVRDHRRILARVWADALAGQPIAREFMQANGPRHLGVLERLFRDAQSERAIDPMAPVQRLMFALGAIALPMLFVPGLIEQGVAPPLVAGGFDEQVLADGSIAQRVDRVLAALAAGSLVDA
jgi:AcrR family transcriptional regulator